MPATRILLSELFFPPFFVLISCPCSSSSFFIILSALVLLLFFFFLIPGVLPQLIFPFFSVPFLCFCSAPYSYYFSFYRIFISFCVFIFREYTSCLQYVSSSYLFILCPLLRFLLLFLSLYTIFTSFFSISETCIM